MWSSINFQAPFPSRYLLRILSAKVAGKKINNFEQIRPFSYDATIIASLNIIPQSSYLHLNKFV